MADLVTLVLVLVVLVAKDVVLIARNQHRDRLVWWLVGWNAAIGLAFLGALLARLGWPVLQIHEVRIGIRLLIAGSGLGVLWALLTTEPVDLAGDLARRLARENAALRAENEALHAALGQ